MEDLRFLKKGGGGAGVDKKKWGSKKGGLPNLFEYLEYKSVMQWSSGSYQLTFLFTLHISYFLLLLSLTENQTKTLTTVIPYFLFYAKTL